MSRDAAKPALVGCAIYTRKSSEEGLDQDFNSLHAQREACEAYVLSQVGEGWVALPQAYDDGGISGGTMERPALKRLLAEVEAGRVDTVVVYKIDRLTRSLGDFARIVEIFDKAGASFVSVTQAFNTTTSMGRLTLNVLLSFAQFEREVTGERIRDKIAASKAKGLWMGGNVPLGYDAAGRTLTINPAEAETVRHIFGRYLELKSVHALRDELEARGYRSKQWTTRAGRSLGGWVISRGALFHTLSNPLYSGHILHKGQLHPGQHPALVDPETFQAVQQALAANAGPKRRRSAGMEPAMPTAPLSGLIYDDRGNRMSPVSARKGEGATYRYYVSSASQQGRSTAAGSLSRAPAPPIETLVLDRARRLGIIGPDVDPWPAIRAALVRLTVGKAKVELVFSRTASEVSVSDLRLHLADGDELAVDNGLLTITAPVVVKQRGGHNHIFGPTGQAAVKAPAVDAALLKALVRAEAWKALLVSGELSTLSAIARRERVNPAFCERLIRLAYLAPDLKRAILEGRQMSGLVLERLAQDGVADLWSEQRRAAHG